MMWVDIYRYIHGRIKIVKVGSKKQNFKISRNKKILDKILLGDPIEKFFHHFSGGFLKFVHLFLRDTRHNSDIPRALVVAHLKITVVTRLDLE
jgi:hypothetical protein